MRRTIGTMIAVLAIGAGAAMIATGASAQEATPTPSLTVPEELLQTPSTETPTTEAPATTPDAAAERDGTCRGGRIGHVVSGLVDDGTITQAQADAIAEGVRTQKEASTDRGPEAKAAALDAALKDLVSKGTITQAQSDAVTAAVETATTSRSSSSARFGGGSVAPSGDMTTTA